MISLSELEYLLPEDLIATHPSSKRDESRLLVYDRKSQSVQHAQFRDLISELDSGDLLIRNEAKVNPVRVLWNKPSGGQAELFFLQCEESTGKSSIWQVLAKGKNLHLGREYTLGPGLSFSFLDDPEGGIRRARMNQSRDEIQEALGEMAQLPLPPYILRERKRRGEETYTREDHERYQTVFAKREGAVAAPTAGLHFTQDLFSAMEKKGVEIDSVFLAVGWGTFQPLSEEILKSGKLHEEQVDLSPDLAQKILKKKNEGKRILAVGTTVTRTLEFWGEMGMPPIGFRGPCDLLLQPPWEPKVVDAMVTNFHLPGSSLLALVGGFLGDSGLKKLLEIY